MRGFIIAVIVCLTILWPFDVKAAEPLLPCSPDATTVMGIGDIVECDIGNINDTDLFQFFGTADEMIWLTITDLTSGSPVPVINFYDCDNKLIDIFSSSDLSGRTKQYTLTETCTYSVVVSESNNDETVDYRIALQRIFPPPPDAQTLCYECALQDSLDPFPDSDVILFDGTDGDVIWLTLRDLTDGSPRPRAFIYDPDRTRIKTLNPDQQYEFLLEKAGTYTAVVWENYEK